MTVVNAWCGAPAPDGVRVVAKVTGSSTRLAVSTEPSLADPVFFGPVAPTGDGVAQLAATGLNAETRYWWAKTTVSWTAHSRGSSGPSRP